MRTGLAMAIVFVAGSVQSVSAGPKSVMREARGASELAGDASAVLGLVRSTVFDLDGLSAPGLGVVASGAAVSFLVPIDGEFYTLNLEPHSVRGADYELVVQLADGSYSDVAPGEILTLRGSVAEIEGSVAAATYVTDGLEVRIILPDDSNYWIEPIVSRVAGAGPLSHVVYRGEDVIPSGGTCAAKDVAEHEFAASSGGGVAAGGLFFAELAIDADFEFFMRFASEPDPVAAVEAHITGIINKVNLQYERDVFIRHLITRFIIRTAEPDPYFGRCSGGADSGRQCNDSGECTGGSCIFDADDILNQFRTHWLSSQSNVRRDLAQLYTGKNLQGNTIGIAWLHAVCLTSTGYSVVQTTCCFSTSCKSDLVAHELGHNWGAEHCNCSGWTMYRAITCSNRFHAVSTIPDIIAHRDTRPCIDKGDELRRVVVRSESDTVSEGETLQFTALADYLFAGLLDVTSEVSWSTDRPEAGSIDADGLFFPANVLSDTCVSVSAEYSDGIFTSSGGRTVRVIDVDAPLAMVATVPPDGAIDARQPFEPDGSDPAGWRSFDITFSGETCRLTAADFVAEHVGSLDPAPTVVSLEELGPRTVRVNLSAPITPGTWTTITHVDSGVSLRVASLPGDVNGDGTAAPPDILSLIDALNGVGDPLPLWATDVDRSGETLPPDILRVIDLLNGAGVYESWLNRSLP